MSQYENSNESEYRDVSEHFNGNSMEYAHHGEIEQEYQSVLGRSADSEGLSYFNNLLQNGSLTLSGLRDALANSKEGLEHRGQSNNSLAIDVQYAHHGEIEQEYQSVLGRSADSEGLSYFNNLLQNGSLTLSGLHDALANSKEGLEHHALVLIGHTAQAELQPLG